MSVEGKVGRAVLDLAEIVKSNTITAVARENGGGKFGLTDEQMAELAIVIGGQIDATIRNSVESITRLTVT
jgi:hypothetical protein